MNAQKHWHLVNFDINKIPFKYEVYLTIKIFSSSQNDLGDKSQRSSLILGRKKNRKEPCNNIIEFHFPIKNYYFKTASRIFRKKMLGMKAFFPF